MAIKKINENILSKINAEDLWAKHNITTRFITLSSTILLIAITIAAICGIKIPNFEVIFKTLANMVLYITIIIILGVNGATKIMSIIKGCNQQNQNQ